MDVFIDHSATIPEELAKNIKALNLPLPLQSISSRGLKVWPAGGKKPVSHLSDHWQLRFITPNQQPARHKEIVELLSILQKNHIDFTKTEHLYLFDGEAGFSKF